MTEIEQRVAFKEFVEFWTGKGYEKGESQKFWIHLLRCLGVENPEQYILFEDQVHLDHTSFIDGRIVKTKVMIEQKSIDNDLNKAFKQSDGTVLTPFQQAKRYITDLPLSEHPRWVITCNFKEFYIYDMEKPHGEPEIIKLADLEKEYYRLSFLLDSNDAHIRKEMEVSIKAGEIVGLIYETLLKQYKNSESEETLKSLNKLCVRLVFCLYAEDSGIFGKHDMFLDYMKQFEAKHFRSALIKLFEILNTKIDERDPYLDEDLAKFPYVNGGLFEDNDIEIPNFTDEVRELLLEKASADFDWSEISPTIFGAVFESTLNPETRRKGGMHYTSIENIHKVIDPLFMDELNKEFDEICKNNVEKTRNIKLKEFQEKIANLTFLDPACGSGNFLTETYISLRKLENRILEILQKGQITIGAFLNPIKVSIQQFYGIEINDFAVTVAKTALWIAESQMMKQTENIVQMDLDFLPLKTYNNIVEGNALRIDWQDVVSKDKLNYIMGNPPFVGARLMSPEQKEDLLNTFGKNWKNAGNLDFVSCWYKKAVDYITNCHSELVSESIKNKTLKQVQGDSKIKCAFVSTNSICQGEQVAILWKPLFEQGINIDFAYTTFRWDSEASLKAHVYCIIVGFSINNNKEKYLFINDKLQKVDNINAYLVNAPNVFIEKRNKPIQKNIPIIDFGSMPNDGGFLSNYSEDDVNNIVKQYPNAKKYFKQLLGATEFINNKKRYCLWLKDINLSEIRNIKPIYEAIENVKTLRENSSREATKKLAETPYLFGEIRQPNSDYILIPRHSSENRKYIPIGYVNYNVICGDSNLIVPNINLYHFGILTSNVHMAWMRTVCGRLKSDYRYSNTIVYNNFPWCEPTDVQKAKIEKTAQGILDARALYPDCSLADLYDDLTMQPELRKAHQLNDIAVMEAYGFKKKDSDGKYHWLTESETVAKLMEMYQKLTK